MKNRLRNLMSVCLIFGMILCGLHSLVFADEDMRRVVVGADLNEEQVNTVYGSFGIQRGEVPELRLTNAGINKEIMKTMKRDSKTKENKKNSDNKLSNVVFSQVLTLIDNMFEFDIESNIIQEILEPKINYYKLNEGLKSTINDVIKSKQEEKENLKKVKKENENKKENEKVEENVQKEDEKDKIGEEVKKDEENKDKNIEEMKNVETEALDEKNDKDN